MQYLNPDQLPIGDGFYPIPVGSLPLWSSGSNFGSDTTNLKVYLKMPDGITPRRAWWVQMVTKSCIMFLRTDVQERNESSCCPNNARRNRIWRTSRKAIDVSKTQTEADYRCGIFAGLLSPTVGGDIATSILSATTLIWMTDNIFITRTAYVWHGVIIHL